MMNSPEQSKCNPLDTRTKCLFQVELMRAMGVPRGNAKAQVDWVDKYAKEASDLINEDSEIRLLVEDKTRWPEAIEKVKEKLREIK